MFNSVNGRSVVAGFVRTAAMEGLDDLGAD
jgi:hypothetical protein